MWLHRFNFEGLVIPFRASLKLWNPVWSQGRWCVDLTPTTLTKVDHHLVNELHSTPVHVHCFRLNVNLPNILYEHKVVFPVSCYLQKLVSFVCRYHYQDFKKRFSRFPQKRPKLARKSRKLLFVTKGNVDVVTKVEQKHFLLVAEICKSHHQVRFLSKWMWIFFRKFEFSSKNWLPRSFSSGKGDLACQGIHKLSTNTL